MTIPRIKTVTIDSHDEAVPVVRFRIVDIDGQPLHLAKDIAALMSLPLDEDGDYRLALDHFGISYRLSKVSDPHGEISGPVALITEHGFRQLKDAVIASRYSQPQGV
ncbi:hypothetical protein [Ensifer sp. YR511]|uniref:hypothetical protein n=1 Tax=Ensifer sp. YR511 TaxID=1855294 RepID=UPI000889B084|nr:hypothetical protein [Ensifer sp. YR511]SDM28798.1 hypothetical protein SAMN05216328_107290 [Ensifer sp. YR511]